jgi:hypothetical protein
VPPIDVLDADERGLRLAQIAELRDARHPRRRDGHPPVEVVRREEREIATQVPVAPDEREHVLGHVLLVAGEDDQVVARDEAVAGRDGVQVLVRVEVGAVAAVREPVDEATRPLRQRTAQEGAPQVDRLHVWIRVPGVAVPVPVGVAQVVRGHRVGRDHDRDPLRVNPLRV